MNYYNLLKNYANNPKRLNWDYYNCHGYYHNGTNRIQSIFNSPRDFIEDTFVHARKSLVIVSNEHGDYNGPNITNARAAHSISSFFLGFIIAEGLLKNDLNRFCSYDLGKHEFEFSYVWNLTCLYHDFGYAFETNKQLCDDVYLKSIFNSYFVKRLAYYYGLKQFAEFQKFRYTYWCPKYSQHDCNDQQDDEYEIIKRYFYEYSNHFYCNGNKVAFPYRSYTMISSYFAYRLLGRDKHKIDHGISGGMIFYDRLIKNYIEEYRKKKRFNLETDFSEFTVKTYNNRVLRIGLDQTVLFSYIADCIINHNIWKASDCTEEIYRKFGLTSLIGNKYKKVNFKENPLLFILALSDTLEPYKNFHKSFHQGKSIDDCDYKIDNVLEFINDFDIQVDKNQIIIIPPVLARESCENNLKSMMEWIDIDFKIADNDDFVITVL